MAFGLLVAILLGIGCLGLSRMDQINAKREEMLGSRWTKQQLSRQALAYSARNSRITMELFFLKDKRVIDPLLKSRAENTRNISELVANLEAKCDSPEEKRLLAAVKDARGPYVASYLRALHLLVDEGKEDAARAIMVEETTPALFKYHYAWDSFMQFQIDEMDKAAKESEARYAATRALVVFLIALAVIVAVAIAFFVTLKITQEMRTRILAERELREFNAELEHRVELRTQELAHSAKALRESEERFQQISNNINQVFYLAGVGSGRIAYVSPAFKKLFGRSWQMSYHAPGLWLEAVIPECREQVQASQKRLLAGEPIQDEYKIIRPDGSTRWIKHHANPIRDAQGQVTKYAGVLEDITEAHAAGEALRQSEEKYRSLLRNIPDVVWTVDSDRRVAFVSPNVEQFLGYSAEDLYRLGARVWFESIHTDDAAKVSEAFEALFAKGEPYDVECRVRCKDGMWIWVHDRAIVTYEKDGKRYADGMVSDITERKQAEQKLRESEDKLLLLLESTAEAIFGIDLQGRCTFCNPACLRLLGYKHPDELLGKHMHELIHHSHRDGTAFAVEDCLMFQAFEKGQGIHLDDQVFWKADGTSFPVEYWSHPQRKGQERVGAVVTFHDITERKRAEEELRSKTAFLEAQVNSTIDGILVIDNQGQKVLHNRQYTDLYKIPQDLVESKDYRPLVENSASNVKNPEEFRQRVAYLFDHPDEIGRDEIELKDGSIIDRYSAPVIGKDGTRYGRIWTFRDITESKQKEEALRRSEAELKAAQRSAHIGSWRRELEADGVTSSDVATWSEEYYRIAGRDPALPAPSLEELPQVWTSESWSRLQAATQKAKDGTPQELDVGLVRPDGTIRWIIGRVEAQRNASGRVVRIHGTVQDITERKQAEEELRSKTAFLEAQVNSTGDGILVVDGENQKILQNQQLMKMLKVPEHIFDQRDALVMRQDVAARTKNPEEFLAKTAYLHEHPSETSRDEIEFQDGTILDRYSSPVVGKEGKYYGRIWTFRNITERRRNEDALRQLSLAVEQSPASIIITDPQGNITYVNPKFTERTGYGRGEVIGQNPRILKSGYTSPDEYNRLWQTITHGGEWHGEFQNKKKNGELFWESVAITPIKDAKGAISHFLAIKEDITEHKAMESQLRQAQKLEAIGQLAAGIAHEINTPTQFASDNLTFLQDSWKSLSAVLEVYRSAIADAMGSGLPEQSWSTIREAERKEDLEFIASEIPRAIEQALDGVQRVAKIVRAMKEFSHPDSGEKALVDINKAIETTITVARNEWKYVAEIETRFCPDLPLVPCHVGELNQVILNLIVNAAHAIKDRIKDGQKGLITLCTSAKGDFAEIAITDTGSGIPEAIRSKVFDPFFTTKEVGKGTGQGLALAHSTIVKKYAGKIWFETEIGRGTTFFIHLPLHVPGGEQEP
ncbi:MAG: PAS domain S-box protein [Terriglobales bacterium]